jgi:hypothetical protein
VIVDIIRGEESTMLGNHGADAASCGLPPRSFFVLHDENVGIVRDEIDEELVGVTVSFFQHRDEDNEVLMGGDHLLVFHGDLSPWALSLFDFFLLVLPDVLMSFPEGFIV